MLQNLDEQNHAVADKIVSFLCFVALLGLVACVPSTPTNVVEKETAPVDSKAVYYQKNKKTPYRVGFNMIRELGNYSNPSVVMSDISELGGQGFRQFRGFDVSWFKIMKCFDYANSACYDFTEPDKYAINRKNIYPILSLGQIGFETASNFYSGDCAKDDSPEYCKSPVVPVSTTGYTSLSELTSNTVLQTEVKNYTKTIASRYNTYGVTHYEALNEPELYKHKWDAAGLFSYNYKPKEYVKFLEITKDALKSVNNDMQLVMGGLIWQKLGSSQTKWEDWFGKILDEGAGNHIDIVNFHFYGQWDELQAHIAKIQEIMKAKNASQPIWMTEVGTSATVNDEVIQAQSVFKFFSVAFGNGVQLINWHTHISSNDGTDNWGGYGLRKATQNQEKNKSWSTYQLFAQNLGNFGECKPIRQGQKVWLYDYSGTFREGGASQKRTFVAWTKKEEGDLSVDLSGDLPSDWLQVKIVSTVQKDGKFEEIIQDIGKKITMTDTPILIQEYTGRERSQ